MKTRADEKAAYEYAVAVVDLLAEVGVFTDTLTARDAVMMAVAKHRFRGGTQFEVIVDDPFTANWRLVADGRIAGRVKLADFHMPSRSGEPTEGEFRRTLMVGAVNGRLRDLP